VILCANPRAQYLAHKEEINEAISRFLSQGRYVLGSEVESFEKEFARYLTVKHAIGVANGTDALRIALAALDVGPGDEVITVSHTAVATISAIKQVGAKPVFVDIDPGHFTIDPLRIEAAISSKTKVIIPVHLYGQPADLNLIKQIAKKYQIKIIEDCAQAHGAKDGSQKVGTWGEMGCFSFYPTKNLGCLGDGGMVVTNNSRLAKKIRLLREYGWKKKYISSISGYNSRLDEIQAAILRVKLKYLNEDNVSRKRIAAYYQESLQSLPLILPKARAYSSHVYHLFVIQAKRRDELKTFLERKGIQTLIHYPVPVHLQPAYRTSKTEKLTQTEKISDKILSLPMYPELAEKDLKTIVTALKTFG
jgi:dTDP-4-amino-4,6-dideoxygalactose transaminase